MEKVDIIHLICKIIIRFRNIYIYIYLMHIIIHSLAWIQYSTFFLQKSCINFCIQAKPMEVYVPEETSGCLYHIWRLVTSPPFENFILFLIVLNTLLLMMKVRVFKFTIYCKERSIFLSMKGNFCSRLKAHLHLTLLS